MFGFGGKTAEEQRDLTANDASYNSTFQYTNNEIKTSYYTWYNFIFINLFEQFHRIVNIYFVFLLVLTFIPEITSLNPVTTLLPILFVLAVTAIKDGVDDYYRHKSDRSINSRKASVLQSEKIKENSWMNVEVGHIMKLCNNQSVPADLLLLSSSEAQDIVFIETAELDGESNLKVRQALPSTGKMGADLKALSKFNGNVKCEAPNNHLHKFTGNLYWEDETLPIDNEKILLRGCTLRNTEWCFGLVIFAGPDTKLMQNTGKHIMKRTRIERFMNRLVLWIFLILFALCSLTAILNSVWEANTGDLFQIYQPWPSFSPNPQMSGFLMFWSNLILLNTLIPISLYVTVEIIRIGQSLYINWDRQMYYEKKDLPAVARTTTLNEELGQVEYIFSDKTGTLTQNIMKFNKCSIAGERYGDIFDEEGKIIFENEVDGLDPVDLSYNEYAEPSFKFYDENLIKKLQSGNEHCVRFFRLVTVCHSAMVEETQDGLVYHTQSPDENALVSAARNFGFVFKGRTFDTILVEEMGKTIEYKILATLEFNNERKRMSVIVEDETGQIILFCKGADSVVYDRLHSANDRKLKDTTTKHLNSFSQTGLRTLCLAMKVIDEDEFKVWNEAYQSASTALEEREEKLSAVYEEIERDMILLGATAIEDKLQDGVPQTIENLSKANIKIWVLTGDKQETAVNIGYSCNMLTEEMKNVFIIQGYSAKEVTAELDKATNLITASSSRAYVNETFEQENESETSSQQIKFEENYSKDHVTFGLVINGHSLVYALSDDLKEKFLKLATSCSAVICCRVTPLQKAKVVELVKKNKKAVTLAIGDGANDVSMIKAAHIGVGISGEEGTQAVLSSDFAFGQFRYLERLLLVHGRWSYMRICKFLNYFFYKNFAFTLVQFWYAIFCGYTAQSAYDDWFITLYNTIYTAIPVLVLAILDQDVDEERCLRLPKLYLPGQRSEYFNMIMFARETIQGLFASLLILFFTYFALYDSVNYNGIDIADYQTMAYVNSTALMLIVTIQIALDTGYWTALNHLFVWGSFVIYFLFSFALCSDGLYNIFPSQFIYVGILRNAFSFPTMWLTVLLIAVTYSLTIVALRLLESLFKPSHVAKILKQHELQERRDETIEVVPS